MSIEAVPLSRIIWERERVAGVEEKTLSKGELGQ
jgi:hypothetical protein